MLQFKSIKNLLFVVVCVFAGLPIFNGIIAGLVKSIKEQIELRLNTDGLQNIQGQKFAIKDKRKQFLIYAELNCDDFALERNKIILSYNWREFIANNTKYKAILALNLVNETDEGLSEIRGYVNSLNSSLKASGKDELVVCVDKENKFRKKYSLPHGSSIIAFGDKGESSIHKLDSFYMHLYSPKTTMFVENFSPVFMTALEEFAKEPLNVKPQELDLSNDIDQDYLR